MPGMSTTEATFAVWPTAWGPMGAVLDAGRIRRIVLPHYQRDDLEQLIGWEHPGVRADTDAATDLIDRTRRYFNGEPVGFDDLPCALPSETSFAGKVLRACREIPYGQTVSYGHLAMRIGREDAARAVAGAVAKNPVPLIVPCHRVTYADGRLGGFSAAGGPELKQRMLTLEAANA